MINHTVCKCSKVAQKEYKTKYDWVGKVIHWDLGRRLKFDHSTKWYMHKLESIPENKMHKTLWDFFIGNSDVEIGNYQ